MAQVRTMYWKEIPAQVQAVDETGQVSQLLDDRFQHGIDAISILDGSTSSDEYLTGWQWGDYTEVVGTASDVALELARHFNEGFPQDFVARIRNNHKAGKRDPTPGSLDHWIHD